VTTRAAIALIRKLFMIVLLVHSTGIQPRSSYIPFGKKKREITVEKCG
jgi:hypothetical protein